MYQRTYLGPSLLDVAKTSVDTFSKVKWRNDDRISSCDAVLLYNSCGLPPLPLFVYLSGSFVREIQHAEATGTCWLRRMSSPTL